MCFSSVVSANFHLYFINGFFYQSSQATSTAQRGRSPRQLDPTLSAVTEVFRILVDSLEHMSHHQSLPFLTHIVNVASPSHYLYVMLGLIVEKCVENSVEQKVSVIHIICHICYTGDLIPGSRPFWSKWRSTLHYCKIVQKYQKRQIYKN